MIKGEKLRRDAENKVLDQVNLNKTVSELTNFSGEFWNKDKNKDLNFLYP